MIDLLCDTSRLAAETDVDMDIATQPRATTGVSKKEQLSKRGISGLSVEGWPSLKGREGREYKGTWVQR